jgi:hypothetical protein
MVGVGWWRSGVMVRIARATAISARPVSDRDVAGSPSTTTPIRTALAGSARTSVEAVAGTVTRRPRPYSV